MIKIKIIFYFIFLTKISFNKSLHPLFTKEETGNFVWIIMHLYSSFFPENPTNSDIDEYQKIIYYLGKHFPCKECANHFWEMVAENPIKFSTRLEMMEYICKIHNIVNKRLNKELFICDKIKDIWGQKDCGCSVKSIKDELINKTN